MCCVLHIYVHKCFVCVHVWMCMFVWHMCECVCMCVQNDRLNTCFSSTHLHPLSGPNQSIFLSIPATQDYATTRSPSLGSQCTKCSGHLLQNCRPRVWVNCSKYPSIPVVAKDHHLIWFNLPIYGANDIIDGALFLVVVDLDEGLAVDRREREAECC